MKKFISILLSLIILIGVTYQSHTVYATIAAKNIKLNKYYVTIIIGETYTLKANITPSNATNKKVTWSSGDPEVATVNSSGKVTAKKEGIITITAKTSNHLKATCEIQVTDDSDSKYRADIKAILDENGYQKDMTDLQKVVLIYDWITANVKYDWTYTHRGLQDALYERKSVCSGYAGLFNEMCEVAGVKCEMSGGTALGLGSDGYGWGGHDWDKVKIGKEWYYVDATWDAAGEKALGTYTYFLRGSKYFSDNNHKIGYKDNVSKTDYFCPNWIYEKKVKYNLESNRKKYNETKALIESGYDNWLNATIKYENEEFDQNIEYDNLAVSDVKYYTDMYNENVISYSKPFIEWLGFHSEEAYIEYKCIEQGLAHQSATKEDKLKAYEPFYEKYPEEKDTEAEDTEEEDEAEI